MDTQEQIDTLNRKVMELERVIQSLRADSTIPYDVSEAFKVRLGQSGLFSSVSALTLGTNVNEAGSGVYTVAKLMDKTVPINLGGVVYSIPLYL